MKSVARYPLLFAVAATLAVLAALPAYPCSTFVLGQGDVLLFGRNWDFYTSTGLIVTNMRGISKTALILPPDTPAQWVSKYGSVTFNQIGREFPYGGMNEAGLVVEIMWLDETKYPEPSGLPAVNEVQWIQYQLDNCGTVAEVIENSKAVRIGQSWSRIHYLVCDKSGAAAAIEYLDGKFVCHTGDSLPLAALTNSTYDECAELLQAYAGFTAEEIIRHSSRSSTDRFLEIARRIDDFKAGDIGPAVDYAFDVLTSIGVARFKGHRTAWSIVYDIANMRIYFKTFEDRTVRFFDVKSLDFSGRAPVRMLDITSDHKGDVSADFVEYSPAVNRAVIFSVLQTYKEAGFLTDLPEFAGEYLASYPETFTRQPSP
jgi:penicillin V acylase-like amidase (Ntn superfamily)